MNFNEDIKKCLDILHLGGTILYPTDTIWGIGCDATNEKAVEKVFKIKSRDESKPLILLVSDEEMLSQFVINIPSVARDLIKKSKNPLTIIYDEPQGIVEKIMAGDKSVGVRIVQDDFCKSLIRKFGKPIVSTSANKSGEPAPQNFSEIKEEIKQAVDYIVKWRQNETVKAKASSVIKLKSNGEVEIIRK